MPMIDSQNRDRRGRTSRARLLFVFGASFAVLNVCGEQRGLSAPPAAAAPQTPPAGWQTYRDPSFGFSIDHPENYVVLPPIRQSPTQHPPLLQSVRFQARGAAAQEIPLFTIDVYDRSMMPLRKWLEAANRLPRDARLAPFNVNGAIDALHVRLLREIAPNEFYYVASESYIFSLTSVGPDGPRMLASFKLRNR